MSNKRNRSVGRLILAFAFGRVRVKGRLMKKLTTASRTFARIVVTGRVLRSVSQRSNAKRVVVRTGRAIVEVDPR